MALIVIMAAVVLCGEIICLMMLIPRMRKLLVLRCSILFDVPDRGQSRQIPSGNAGTSTTKSEEEKFLLASQWLEHRLRFRLRKVIAKWIGLNLLKNTMILQV